MIACLAERVSMITRAPTPWVSRMPRLSRRTVNIPALAGAFSPWFSPGRSGRVSVTRAARRLMLAANKYAFGSPNAATTAGADEGADEAADAEDAA